MAKKAKSEKAAEVVGDDLFPLPKSALGKAAEKFVDTLVEIADAKKSLHEIEEVVIDEMEKESRLTLLIVHGGDRYLFEVKRGNKKLRCVKKNKQPAKTVEE